MNSPGLQVLLSSVGSGHVIARLCEAPLPRSLPNRGGNGERSGLLRRRLLAMTLLPKQFFNVHKAGAIHEANIVKIVSYAFL
jgi:hypothetical protein